MRLPASIARYRPLVLPCLLLLFTAAYLQDALSAGKLFRYGLPGASFMPVVLSGIMFAGLTVVIVQEVIGILRHRAEATSGAEISLAPLWIAGATLALVLLLKILGFLVAGTFYVFALLTVFGVWADGRLRGVLMRAVLSAGIAGLVYLFFTTFFSVKLPAGILA
ncbi:MAG: tripartite tricarboxylate transporter TctB family protein [Qingshengfaniella sp.]